MTDEEIDADLGTCARSTEGEWVADPEHFLVSVEVEREHEHVVVRRCGEDVGPLCDVFGTNLTAPHDCRFIAEAHAGWPRALLDLKALRAALWLEIRWMENREHPMPRVCVALARGMRAILDGVEP